MEPEQSVQTRLDEPGQGGSAKLGIPLNKNAAANKDILIFTYFIDKC
mgnify:CR=1